MYRTNETSKLSQDLEPDEVIYEFSGATLKISNDEPQNDLNIVRNRMNKMEESAILTGSDMVSIPSHHSSIDRNVIENEDNTEKKINTSYVLTDETVVVDDHDDNNLPTQITGSTANFFSFRSGQLEKAINDCINQLLRPENDLSILGSWLLAELSHWDHEREKLYILTSKSLFEIKYDFIGLTISKYYKIQLCQIDTVLRGKLTYPQKSLVPRIEGITNGIASLICTSFFPSATNRKRRQQAVGANRPATPPLAVSQRFDFSSFRPVEKKDLAIRILWNRGKSLSIIDSWNPIAKIPWKTIKDHPLYAFNDPTMSVIEKQEFDKIRYRYSFDSLYNALVGVFSASNPESRNFECCFEDGPILMENYVGIGAVIHNKNDFGFFKCRGKFSF